MHWPLPVRPLLLPPVDLVVANCFYNLRRIVELFIYECFSISKWRNEPDTTCKPSFLALLRLSTSSVRRTTAGIDVVLRDTRPISVIWLVYQTVDFRMAQELLK